MRIRQGSEYSIFDELMRRFGQRFAILPRKLIEGCWFLKVTEIALQEVLIIVDEVIVNHEKNLEMTFVHSLV